MLNEDVITRLQQISGDEDAALWEQGDILHDNEITKDEVKRLAVILQQTSANLLNRQFVAAENPIEHRRLEYSWKLYAIFTKIADREQRYSVLFNRNDWTLAEAKEIVKVLNPTVSSQSENKLEFVERASLKVGNVEVKATLNPSGQLTLRVNLGANRECIVTPQSVNTKIVFPA